MDVVLVVDVVGTVCWGSGKVTISAPSVVASSVSDPVRAPGVLELAPDRLATQSRSPRTAKADN